MEKRVVLGLGAVALAIAAVVVLARMKPGVMESQPSPSAPLGSRPVPVDGRGVEIEPPLAPVGDPPPSVGHRPDWIDEPPTAAGAPEGEPADLVSAPPPGAGSTTRESVEVERYLVVEAPDRVGAGKRLPVIVSLTIEARDASVELVSGVRTADGRLVLPTGALQVVLSAPAFEIDEAIRTLTVEPLGDSAPLLFQLQAKAIDAPTLESRLHVSLWREGTLVASAIRRVTILRDVPADPPVESSLRRVPLDPPTKTPMEGTVVAPDLTLELWTDGGRPGYATVTVASPYRQTPRHEIVALEDLRAWLDTRLGGATRGSRGVASAAAAAEARVGSSLADWRGLGRELYRRLAPPAFQQMFWDLVDARGDELRTIQIHTDVPWIPWELMIPCRPDGSGERDFLGAELCVGRWHISERTALLARPPQRTSVAKRLLIAPRYSGGDHLPAQTRELEALRGLARFDEVRGDRPALEALFADVPQALLHFAGHGVLDEGAAGVASYSIVLEDGALDLVTWLGLAPARFATHPFFFFNACDVGRSERVATFVEGWAPAALERGACGYVGAILPLVDAEASAFAIEFYGRLFGAEHGRVADALRAARRAFLERGEAVGLAYVFYGDPNLTLER